MAPELRLPWTIFADAGKSIAVLPAGRPGEVCDVRHVPDDIVKRQVDAANRWPAFASVVPDELREMERAWRAKRDG
jgi:hypothetical protein